MADDLALRLAKSEKRGVIDDKTGKIFGASFYDLHGFLSKLFLKGGVNYIFTFGPILFG